MMLNLESPVPFGEIGLSVPKTGDVGDRLESLMECVDVDLPLPACVSGRFCDHRQGVKMRPYVVFFCLGGFDRRFCKLSRL